MRHSTPNRLHSPIARPLTMQLLNFSAGLFPRSIKRFPPTAFAFLCSLATVCCLLIPATSHAEFSLRPSITVSEEYNDNVFESNIKKSDFITRAMPGVALTYVTPFWDWDLAYNYDYRYYARNSREDEDTHNLVAKGLIRLIDEFLLLDLNDTYRRVSLDISRDRTQEGLFVNQSDTNNLSASPYLQFHPVRQATIKTGYRYSNIWFSEPSGIDRRNHIAFLDLAYDYSQSLTLMANHTYTRENSVEGFDRHTPYIGGRFQYGEKSFILALGGLTITDLDNGPETKKPYWNVGITHSFDHTSIALSSVVQYPVDPQSGVTRETDYTLSINRELARGNTGLTLRYADFSGTSTAIEKSFGAALNIVHLLTENLSGSLNFSIDRFDHQLPNSHTRRIIVAPSLSYAFPNEFNIGLNYTFIDSHSPQVIDDNYQANRVILSLSKSFGREVERIGVAVSGPGTATRGQ